LLDYFPDCCFLLSAEWCTSENSGKFCGSEIVLARIDAEKEMGVHKCILLVSRDVLVLQTRKLMLGAYFEVCAAGRVREATALLGARKFDLIVLCYTLTDDDCEKIVNAAQLHSPGAKILTLTVTGHAGSQRPADSYFLPAQEGPFILMKKAAELLGFEFRSKGRMVAIPQPNVVANVSRVA
jgi:hypothetical protein